MEKTINFTEYHAEEFKKGDFVACDETLGFITDIKNGIDNRYVSISWLDGAKTEHRYTDLQNDGVAMAYVSPK